MTIRKQSPSKDELKPAFARNFDSIRKEMGLTQEKMARKLDVTLGTVSKWCQGTSEPPLEKIREVAKKLNVSLGSLVNEQNSEGE